MCVRERERGGERWRRASQPNKEKIETCADDESLISGQDRTFFFHLLLSLSFSFSRCTAQSLAMLSSVSIFYLVYPSFFFCVVFSHFLAGFLSSCQMSISAISSSSSVSHFLHFTFTVHFQ